MLEKCPKIGVRSYANDNRREYENADKPQKHHVSGVFLLPLETW